MSLVMLGLLSLMETFMYGMALPGITLERLLDHLVQLVLLVQLVQPLPSQDQLVL
jgi:hypothetical protein